MFIAFWSKLRRAASSWPHIVIAFWFVAHDGLGRSTNLDRILFDESYLICFLV
jgi:hypothetical protein